jgi:hypothetical protein
MAIIRGIPRVNGGVQADQFLTAELSFFQVSAGANAVGNINAFGYEANGAPRAGESAVLALQTVANPVIIEAANATTLFVVTELGGVDAGVMQAALRAALPTNFPNALIVEGSLSVDVS